MIVLETLDTLHNTARLRRRDRREVSAQERREFEERLVPVGLNVVFDETELCADPGTLEHTWREEDDRLVYEVRVPHEWESASVLGTYLVATLATLVDLGATTTRAVRLAAYELAVNSLEHGVPRDDLGRQACLWLRIEASESAVEVTLQDECEPFDPTVVDRPSIQDQADAKACRGYGISMVRALVEGLRHEYNESGNRIQFRKETR